MNNPTLIIYDKNGRVYSIQQGIDTVPSGLEDCSLIADAPEGFVSVTIDVANKTASFTLGEQEKLKAQLFYTAMITDTLIEEE